MTETADRKTVAALAARHGIEVDAATLRFVEAGLDYRVAFGSGAEPVVLSVLDWTTARVGDPAIDFMYHHMISPRTFDLLVETYREAGGEVPARLAERCAALLAAGPINYGAYALETGDPAHTEAARAQLCP